MRTFDAPAGASKDSPLCTSNRCTSGVIAASSADTGGGPPLHAAARPQTNTKRWRMVVLRS
jgi:hypothetical protein